MLIKQLKIVLGMKETTSMMVTINGKIASNKDCLYDGDNVKFLMVVGAG